MERHKGRRKRLLVTLAGGGFFWETVALLSQFDKRFCYHYLTTRPLPRSLEQLGIPKGTEHRVTSLTRLGRSLKRQAGEDLLRSLWEVGRVMRRVDPDVVITVGSSLAVPLCLWARLMGRETIFVESITRVTVPSRTGRILDFFRLCDGLYVQWPESTGMYRNALYGGNVL
ncbi:Oligosaccharide biosynthesis protein Alg14 like [Desulfacinum hydrothermale DSM 13146]|uniref:Oligosaccharide biosynthesis protein Alg14 like n=1 Tax=Desulfacinum hydrothermale DSM 13146 TaxID=1121390 RepID=A0A1W1XQP5_9BACT|nr:hypothetical protein [Desulfacinum hydrothermale]SMC26283.1 Oligosaccharide biosynthesis protein Alg14 like [Desulfacinum hydrothermale DSM 13146]